MKLKSQENNSPPLPAFCFPEAMKNTPVTSRGEEIRGNQVTLANWPPAQGLPWRKAHHTLSLRDPNGDGVLVKEDELAVAGGVWPHGRRGDWKGR